MPLNVIKVDSMLKAIVTTSIVAASLILPSCSTTSTPPGEGAATSGCAIDARKVCEADKELRRVQTTGEADTQSQQEQNLPPTQTWIPHFTTPDGTLIEIDCEINIRHHSVIYAHLMPGPKLTDGDLDYLRNQGLCAAKP